MAISIKTEKQIGSMRRGGAILAGIMREVGEAIKPGISTADLDKLAEELVLANGAKPSFKGYGEKANPFPATLCISLNDEVVHGIPRKEKFISAGDLVKIDVGMYYEGMHTDMARTFAVGLVSKEALRLIGAAEGAFWEGVAKLKDGAYVADYARAAERVVKKAGFSVVRNLVGHGIGKELHEDPQVPNFYERAYRPIMLSAGMTLALEPMVNAGKSSTYVGSDGWAYKTSDGSLSAHYENTVLITEEGAEVLTQE